jgi:hypothetical protein
VWQLVRLPLAPFCTGARQHVGTKAKPAKNTRRWWGKMDGKCSSSNLTRDNRRCTLHVTAG